ncbi:MAG: MFS transporter [Lentisphaerae bacterium GWF2_45_14]|nr:MAG: MFS transporter [Lentisphaerae bacterium GWF2_45_14]
MKSDKGNKIPRSIWSLGFVSMFMDISSEIIHSLLPVFMVSVLGISTFSVGIVEGIAEAAASISKVFSGALSDWLGKRKILAVIGYGMAALTKPLFPLAGSLTAVATARFIDRIGKGIRGAPRDALVAEIAPPALRGECYGLRQSLDTLGAFLGPLLAILLMWISSDNYRLVFWIAVIPAFIALYLMIFSVKEPSDKQSTRTAKFPINRTDLARLGKLYWAITGIAAVASLARFSVAFLVLKANETGLLAWLLPLVFIVMNLVYTLSSYPAGKLSDRIDRKYMLLAGLVVLIISHFFLAFSGMSLLLVIIGVALWGLHMGLTQGVLAAIIVDITPKELKGTAFGMFNLVTGIAVFFSSGIAGCLWYMWGAQVTFAAGIVFAFAAAVWLFLLGKRTERRV